MEDSLNLLKPYVARNTGVPPQFKPVAVLGVLSELGVVPTESVCPVVDECACSVEGFQAR